MQFQPVWDARNEAITLYRCIPQPIAVRQGSSVVALEDLAPKFRTKVELSCLHQGITTLARHIERGERFLMAFSVAYETLSSHTGRVEFTNACRELSSDFRQYIVMQEHPRPGNQAREMQLPEEINSRKQNSWF